MEIILDKTHCLYPDNVKKAGEDDDEEPAASHKLPYEEKINLKCGSGLDMFINQSGTYRYVQDLFHWVSLFLCIPN